MKEFLNDQAVAERILHHMREGSTDRGEEVWREPVANYRSEERLDREIKQVLRRSPVPLCPSAALPEPGSYLAREAGHTPLLAVRGKDGVVRVFRNTCRHRGTQLTSGSGCAKALVCPYHGWAYGLDGALQSIPHESGFPGLDKGTHGLVSVAAQERLGLVWVTQDDSVSNENTWEGLPELVGEGQELINMGETEVEANWKVYLEGFIEGYHIMPTHKETFYPYGFDNLNLVETVGRNSRITYPFRRIEKLADVPPQDRRVEGLLTYVYHLFPNAVVTVLSRHTNLVVLEPIDLNRTRVFNYSLTNSGGGAEAAALAKRDAAFVSETGAAEDLKVVTAIQRSIDSGANEVFSFGHFEALIAHFHRTLKAALD